MLSGQTIPDVNFNGLQFGSVALAVGGGRLVAVAALPGRPAPDVPDLASLPGGDFYVLLSPDAVRQAAQQGAAGLVGKQSSVSGSQGFGIGEASYNASVAVRSAAAEPAGDPTTLAIAVGVDVNAGAGVDMVQVIGQQIVGAATTVGGAFQTAGQAIADTFSSY
jgi:hypothetical protein